jgi:hypothetical protein
MNVDEVVMIPEVPIQKMEDGELVQNICQDTNDPKTNITAIMKTERREEEHPKLTAVCLQ